MSWKYYLLFGCLSLMILIPISFVQTTPGYLDAEYYCATAAYSKRQRLLEPFIRNYLNSFYSIHQPAFDFWMPLPSYLAALEMALTGFLSSLVLITWLFMSGNVLLVSAAAVKIKYLLNCLQCSPMLYSQGR